MVLILCSNAVVYVAPFLIESFNYFTIRQFANAETMHPFIKNAIKKLIYQKLL
jgi:hypothetical protein